MSVEGVQNSTQDTQEEPDGGIQKADSVHSNTLRAKVHIDYQSQR